MRKRIKKPLYDALTAESDCYTLTLMKSVWCATLQEIVLQDKQWFIVLLDIIYKFVGSYFFEKIKIRGWANMKRME